jgi:hypothetical protein
MEYKGEGMNTPHFAWQLRLVHYGLGSNREQMVFLNHLFANGLDEIGRIENNTDIKTKLDELKE